MPRICSGCDKQNFETIRNSIKEIFAETHVKIVVHNLENNEININDNDSIIPNYSDSEDLS